MLVDDPQSVVAGGQNERLAQLPQRAQRAQMVEVGGGLLGLDQGRFRRGIRAVLHRRMPGEQSSGGGRLAGWKSAAAASPQACWSSQPPGLEALRSQRKVCRERAWEGAASAQRVRRQPWRTETRPGRSRAAAERSRVRRTGQRRCGRRHQRRAGCGRGVQRGQKTAAGRALMSAVRRLSRTKS